MARLGHVAVVEPVEFPDLDVGMPRHLHHAPEIGVLLVAAQHLPPAVAREDQDRRAVGTYVVQRRHVVHDHLRIGNPHFAASREMGHDLPAVRDQRRERRVGVDAVGRHPAFVQPDHRSQVTARRMSGDEDQPRVAAVGSNVFHHPSGRSGGIRHAVGDLHARSEAVIHAHHGESFAAQRFRNLAPPAGQAPAVEPHDGRKSLPIRRPANVQPAKRIDIAVARRVAVGNAGFGPAGGRLGRNPRAEQGQSREKRKKSFHGIRSFWVIKIGKIP